MDEGHRDRTIHTRIPRSRSIVAAYPDMAFRHDDVFSGGRKLTCGVYADDITRKSNEAFAYKVTALNWGFEDEEVSVS